jgi:hypothetical protein
MSARDGLSTNGRVNAQRRIRAASAPVRRDILFQYRSHTRDEAVFVDDLRYPSRGEKFERALFLRQCTYAQSCGV